MCSDSCHDGIGFNPQAYLETYYTRMDEENKQLLTFWDSLPVKENMSILEVGCGPTIFTAIPIAWKVNQMTLTDAMEENLDEIKLWLSNDKQSFRWQPIIDYYFYHSKSTLKLRQRYVCSDLFANYLRTCIHASQFDLHKDELAWKYDGIVTAFCLAEACDCASNFTLAVEKLIGSLKTHGVFGLVTAINSSGYMIGDTHIPMTFISANTLIEIFTQHFNEISLKFIPIDMDRGYTQIAAIWGKR